MSVDTVLFVLGAVLAFGGWIALWLGTRMLAGAFGLGFGYGFGLALALVIGLPPATARLVELGCAMMGAFGGILLIRAINSFLLALSGFLLGVLIGRLALQIHASLIGHPWELSPTNAIILVGGGAVAALVALYLRRTLALVITAFVGSAFLCASMEALTALLPWSFAGLLVASMAVQWFLASVFRRSRGRSEEVSA